MLINFKVSNFRSFDKEIIFSMEAGKTRNFSDRILRTPTAKITKFKAIYGANASGKSNLIKALGFMQDVIRFSLPAESVSEYCRMAPSNFDLPSKFEVEIIVDNVRYTYGFEVLLSAGNFIKEWLYETQRQRSKCVFVRDIISGTYDVSTYLSNTDLANRLNFYADDIKQDGSVLFLQIMNKNKDSLYISHPSLSAYLKVYRWFRTNLSVNHPNGPITQYTYFFNSQGSAKAEELLAFFDTGISKVKICDEPTEKIKSLFPKQLWFDIVDRLTEQKRNNEADHIDQVPAIMLRNSDDHSMYIIELEGEEINCKTLKFSHKHSTSLFSLREESDGTVRLLDLLEVLLSNSQDMVYCIDEISRCLHPMLTRKFVKYFLKLATERNIQLIVTTHETDLMDLEFLRQDEIGFVGKRDEDGTSVVFGLEDFGARFDKRIRKAYLDGEYGGVPIFDNSK